MRDILESLIAHHPHYSATVRWDRKALLHRVCVGIVDRHFPIFGVQLNVLYGFVTKVDKEEDRCHFVFLF